MVRFMPQVKYKALCSRCLIKVLSSRPKMAHSRLYWTLTNKCISNLCEDKPPEEDPSVRRTSIVSMPASMRNRSSEEIQLVPELVRYDDSNLNLAPTHMVGA